MRNKRAYIWSFGGRIIPQTIFLLTNIILAHYLSPGEFGQIGILSLFISISTTLTDAGFGGSLIKEKDILPIDLSTVFVYNLVVSIVSYFILFLCAPSIESYYRIEGLTNVTRALGLVFVINAWALIPKTLLIKNLKFKEIAIVGIIGVCLASIVSIIGAINGWGVYSLVSYQIAYVLNEVICLEVLTKYKQSFRFSILSFKKLFSFGFYTTLCNVIEDAYKNIITSLFGKFLSIKDAGYIFQAQKLENAATSSLTQTINIVAFPILTKLKLDIVSFSYEANTLFRNICLLIFPLLWIVVIYSQPFITLIYGADWSGASIFLSLLMIAGFFFIMDNMIRIFIKSLGEVKSLAKYTLLKRGFGLICILSFMLIGPFFMMYGFILSTIIGYLVNIYLYGKMIKMSFFSILWCNSKSALFTIIFPFLYYIIHLADNMYIEISLLLAVLLSFYFLVLPKIIHINILGFLRSHK